MPNKKPQSRLIAGLRNFLVLFRVFLNASGMQPALAAGAAFANFVAAQTNPIRPSADGTRRFAVITPAASLSVFDFTNRGCSMIVHNDSMLSR